MSHDVKLTGSIGKLIPVLCQPVIPGDKWKINTQFLLRLNPLVAPMMQQMNIYFHAFFVPNRLLWDNWEEFITRGTQGESKPELPYTTPNDIYQYLANNYLKNTDPSKLDVKDFVSSLPDYMGLPVEMMKLTDGATKISVMPFKGYQFIYNEYYRDETLEPEVELYKDTDGYHKYGGDGEPLASLFTLRNRAWAKDYFTGSLPWPLRLEGEDIALPLYGDADVTYRQSGQYMQVDKANPGESSRAVGVLGADFDVPISIDSSGILKSNDLVSLKNGGYVSIDLQRYISADQLKKLQVSLRNGSTVTINQLREALRLQQWLEANARGGSRYTEQLLSHFGVRSKDARLQRPEYLGGFSAPVNISEVVQTSQTDDATGSALGQQGGHGFALNGGRTIKRYFDEHGYIYIIMSARPRPSYMQGIPKDFTKMDNLDFYFPEFQHLGEQAVSAREIYYSGTSKDEETFGYVPRYSEYKYAPNRICGRFRTDMKFYHMARIFSETPKLNADFITCDESLDGLDRVFAIQKDPDTNKEYPHLWFDVAHNVKCSRLMSRYGVPKLL